ncbi:MAG: phytoene synthase, partial [Pseudomonadota bacterium]
ALLTARAADMDPDFPTDLPALLDYLRKVSGGMMQLAVRVALSGAGARDAAAGDLGLSQGVAAYLAAMPALQARDRRALPPGGAAGDAVQHLAAEGLAALARARETGLPRRALPATLAAATAPVRLRRAAAAPAAVPTTGPQVSEFRLRLAPLAATLLGRV